MNRVQGKDQEKSISKGQVKVDELPNNPTHCFSAALFLLASVPSVIARDIFPTLSPCNRLSSTP